MASNDDEYFKATLSLRYDLGEHKDILKIRPATLRAFEKPAKKQFRTAILSTLRQSTIFGPDGQALRSYNVRLERLYRVVRRIACGLFFDQTGQRLDPAYGTGVLGDEELSTLDKRFRDEFLGYLARARTAVYGDNVFSFRGFRNAEDRMMTGWQFHFYGKIEFIAATLPLQVLETEESLGD